MVSSVAAGSCCRRDSHGVGPCRGVNFQPACS